MNGDYLLDTNVIVAFLREETVIIERVVQADSVLIPSVAIGELAYGAYNSTRQQADLARIHRLMEKMRVVGCDERTGLHYDAIKAELRRRDRMIPENDIWIAAIALQDNLILVSRDKHFSEVEGLRLERWDPA
jgi:tRNA(fMet)-specific endonuclease VapC